MAESVDFLRSDIYDVAVVLQTLLQDCCMVVQQSSYEKILIRGIKELEYLKFNSKVH